MVTLELDDIETAMVAIALNKTANLLSREANQSLAPRPDLTNKARQYKALADKIHDRYIKGE